MSGAEDNSSVSSASDPVADDNLHVQEDHVNGAIGDADFYKDVIGRLDNVEISPNLDMPDDFDNEEDEKEDSQETESVGAESTASDTSKGSKTKEQPAGAGDVQEVSKAEPEVTRSKSLTTPKKKSLQDSKDSKEIKTGGSVFSKLRRLTKADKKSRQKPADPALSDIKIDKLPQIFVAKFLGTKPTKGLFGLQHVRKPVDKLIGALKKDLSESERVELPLVYVVISSKGIEIRQHGASKVKDAPEIGLIPIDFISYGVQDMKYWKVFTFIVVSELSSRNKTTECHALLCESNTSARKMALSLAAAFHVYKKTLSKQGKPNNFNVELRPPDELAEAFTEECEA